MTKTFKYSDTLINAAFCFLLAALLLAIGGTLAQVTNALNHNENKGYLDVKLVQTYGPGGDTPVYPGFTQERTCKVNNYGSEVAYVRVRLDKYWANRSGSGASEQFTRTDDPQYNTDYIEITYDDLTNWVYDEDGWYYYASAINPGEETANLLSAVTISEQVGEEHNDAQQTRKDHDNITSIYLDKAGIVDVELQAVTTEYDPGKKDDDNDNKNQGGNTSGDASDGSGSGSGTEGTDSASKYVPASLKSQFASETAETGDSISQTALVLFALAALSLCVFVVLLIASKRRNDKNQFNQNKVQEID